MEVLGHKFLLNTIKNILETKMELVMLLFIQHKFLHEKHFVMHGARPESMIFSLWASIVPTPYASFIRIYMF